MTDQPSSRWPPTFLRSAGIGLGLGLLCFLLSTLPLIPGPRALTGLGTFILEVGVLLVFFPVAAVLALPVFAFVAIFSSERKPWARRWLVLCLTVILGVWLGILGDVPVRRARFSAATARAGPVIQAIEAHRAATGRWPESLETLLPSRLSAPPATGMIAYPEFRYKLPVQGNESFKNYELSISCPRGVLNFDVFVYWPEKVYPDSMYGGWVERIGDWAYVHE